MLFSPLYLLFALPALILGLYAQARIRSAYQRYLRVANDSQVTGLEAGQRLLAAAGLGQIEVQGTRGELTDHYDPRSKALYLSAGVAQSPSVASLGIVAHEVGHAMQDQEAYAPLKLRSAIVPAVQIGSWLGPILFLLGMFFVGGGVLSLIGVLLFSSTLAFSLVTLPVEYNASNRAVALLQQTGLVRSADEEQGVRAVLSAAALTYVAAAAQSLSTLLYYVFLLGGSRRRR